MSQTKKLMKGLLGILLSLALMLGLLPGMSLTVKADDVVNYNLWVGGTQVTSANAGDVFNDGKVSYDAQTNTLTLNGYSNNDVVHKWANNTNSAGIYAEQNLTINLTGTNTITNNTDTIFTYGIRVYEGKLSINGSGTLKVTATVTDENNAAYGINANGIGLENATVTARGTTQGITSNGAVTIKSGELTAEGNTGFYVSGASFTMEGGTVTASGKTDGIHVGYSFIIKTGSKLTAIGENGGISTSGSGIINEIAGTGWTDVEGTQGETVIPASEDAQDISEYKKVQFPAAIHVSYNSNGATSGTEPADSKSYMSGNEVTVLGNGNLEKSGCTFADWNTEADGTGTSHASGSTFKISSDTTLFAQWKHNTTTFKAGDRFSLIDSAIYKLGDTTLTGKEIKTAYQIQDSELTIKDVKYNAEAQNVEISFPNTQTTVPVPARGTSNPLGFSVRGSGTKEGPYYFEAVYDEYTVTYDGNGNTGGTAPTDEKSYVGGETVTVLDNTGNLVKTDYTFDGWNTKADGTGTSYKPNDTFTLSENTTLFAMWTESSKPEPTPTPTPTDAGITLNLSETFLTLGMERALKATVTPSGTPITWTSSDKTIAFVNNNGIVTGLKLGTATITATITVDGKEYSASCKVTVVPASFIPSGNGDGGHTHKFIWETIEATEEDDGELRYQCEICGEIQTRVPLTAYNVFNKNTTEKIRKAPKDSTVKIETNKWISFHKMVMEALAERPDVTLEISFLDEGCKGKRCTVIIPKGTDVMSLVDKNGFTGFLYLGGKFGIKTY